MSKATVLINGTYEEIESELTREQFHSEVVSAAEVTINGFLTKLPWFRAQRTHIERKLGGYAALFQDALTYVLTYTVNTPNEPSSACKPAAAALAQDLRALFDGEPYTNPLAPTDVIVSPLLNNDLSSQALELIGLAPDDRGQELLMDVAHGSSVAAAAANQGITRQTAHERMQRIRQRAKEALNG